MAPLIKTLESKLRDLGYTHNWNLIKSDADIPDTPDTPHPSVDYDEQSAFYQALLENIKSPLCQTIDVVVPLCDDERSQEERSTYQQFLKIIGSPCPEQELRFINNTSSNSSSNSSRSTTHATSHIGDLHEFTYVQNDENRHMAIKELIDTESTYVDKLRTTVNIFTQKLNPQSHTHRRIIEPYDYKKIFSNIEELLAVNERFLLDLFNCSNGSNSSSADATPPVGSVKLCFGEVCASHMANFVDCYRTYLLNYFTAQIFHASVMKNNFDYRRFIYDVLNDPRCENKALFDYLIEPPQRIGRYTMILKNILVHTSPDHPDYAPLTQAYSKANEIALLADDEATKMATMCYNLFNSVKWAPCTMLSQHRTPIAYMDASELHRETSKPKRAVTIVLLSDKLLVAERPNYHSRGIDLSDSGDTSLDGFLSRNLSKDPSLKFRGWIDIEQVQFFKGASGIPDSFLICVSSAQRHGPGPIEPADTFDKYFRSGGPRLFQVTIGSEGVQKMNEFIETCQKAQTLARRYDQTDEARYRRWSDTNLYTNIYDTMSYTSTNYKSNIAVVYVEQEKPTSLKSLFRGAGSITPWIVALVQGRPEGFRFSIMSKVPLKPSRRIIQSITCTAMTSDVSVGYGTKHGGRPVQLFPRVFWDNIIYIERHLRHSPEYIHIQEAEMEPYQRTRRRSRSRSLSRSTSFTTLSNLFSGGGIRSRSTSPSRHQVKPESSRSSPTSGGRTTPKEFFSTFTRKSRSRSSSVTSAGDRSIKSTASSTTTMATEVTGTGNGMVQPGRSNGNSRFSLPSSLLLPELLLRRPLVASPQEGKSPTTTNEPWTVSAAGTTVSPNQASYFNGGPPPSFSPSYPFMMHSPSDPHHPLRTERDHEFSYQHQYSTRRNSRSPPNVSTTEGEADPSHSRPSSRNSSPSSTPNLAFSQFNRASSPHSNTMPSSPATHSTRSSLSSDEFGGSPTPTLRRVGSTQESATDAIRKIRELMSAQGTCAAGNGNGRLPTTTVSPMRPPERNNNGFVVSSIPNDPSRGRNYHPAADKFRSLSGRLLSAVDSLQARAIDTNTEQSYTLCNQFNTDLENIAATVGSFRQDRGTSGMMDVKAAVSRKVRQVHAERDHWDRHVDDIKAKATKMSHHQPFHPF